MLQGTAAPWYEREIEEVARNRCKCGWLYKPFVAIAAWYAESRKKGTHVGRSTKDTTPSRPHALSGTLLSHTPCCACLLGSVRGPCNRRELRGGEFPLPCVSFKHISLKTSLFLQPTSSPILASSVSTTGYCLSSHRRVHAIFWAPQSRARLQHSRN